MRAIWIFASFLVLEYSNPAYGEVDMLTVAYFMIQHRRYSDEALVWIEHSCEGISKRAKRPWKSAGRLGKMWARPAALGACCASLARPLPEIGWTMTIRDVAAGYQDAESYCALVKQVAPAAQDEIKPYL